MKTILGTLALVLVSSQAMASDLLGNGVAPNLVSLTISHVGTQGAILKRSQTFPNETIVVGIPVNIELPDACTTFVGQTTEANGLVLETKGAQDVLNDNCIAVKPLPIPTQLTVSFVVNNESLPVVRTRKLVAINGASYVVTLDPKNETVGIFPARFIPEPVVPKQPN